MYSYVFICINRHVPYVYIGKNVSMYRESSCGVLQPCLFKGETKKARDPILGPRAT